MGSGHQGALDQLRVSIRLGQQAQPLQVLLQPGVVQLLLRASLSRGGVACQGCRRNLRVLLGAVSRQRKKPVSGTLAFWERSL